METKYYSRKVCEKLADELVSVETEIAKQSILLESIKKVIAERKTDVIKCLLWGEKLHFPSKTYMVADVVLGETKEIKSGFFVQGTLATDPESVEKADIKLSAAEAKLFAEYKEAYENYYNLMDKDELVKMQEVADKMRGLKNKLNLILCKYWAFRFDDVTNAAFFEETGVRVYLDGGYNPLLETLRD
jgi:hypothetical protein